MRCEQLVGGALRMLMMLLAVCVCVRVRARAEADFVRSRLLAFWAVSC